MSYFWRRNENNIYIKVNKIRPIGIFLLCFSFFDFLQLVLILGRRGEKKFLWRKVNQESFQLVLKSWFVIKKKSNEKWNGDVAYSYVEWKLLHTHTHTHIYMCVCVCVCASVYIYRYIYEAVMSVKNQIKLIDHKFKKSIAVSRFSAIPRK